jgi:hypothetical protein
MEDGLSLSYQTITAVDRPSVLTVIENYTILRKLRAEGLDGFLREEPSATRELARAVERIRLPRYI